MTIRMVEVWFLILSAKAPYTGTKTKRYMHLNTHTHIYIYTYDVLLTFKTTWLSVGNAFPCCCQHHCGILEWLELLAHLLEELAGGASLRATWEWNSILQQTTGLVMLVLVPLVYQKNSRYYILKYFTEPMPKLETYFWEMAHWVRYNRMTIPNCWKDELKLHLCQTVYLPDFKKLHHIEWYGSGSICTLQTEIPLTIVHHCPMRE